MIRGTPTPTPTETLYPYTTLFQSGATRVETSEARAQRATVEALVPELTQRRNTLVNALALLLGEEPRALDAQLLEAMPLPSLPSNVPMGLPSELAHRRPDRKSVV